MNFIKFFQEMTVFFSIFSIAFFILFMMIVVGKGVYDKFNLPFQKSCVEVIDPIALDDYWEM